MIQFILRLLLGCAHSWKVLVERELPSVAEEMSKNNVPVTGLIYGSERIRACKKKIVAVVSCEKCGALRTKTFVND